MANNRRICGFFSVYVSSVSLPPHRIVLADSYSICWYLKVVLDILQEDGGVELMFHGLQR
jgi:hypothetical protein